MNPRCYPLNTSLKNTLRTLDAPTIGVRLLYALMVEYDLTQSQAEALLVLATYRKPASFDEICEDDLIHLSRDNVKRVLMLLVGRDLVETSSVIDNDGFLYTIKDEYRAFIKSITLGQLENVSANNYVEALMIVKPLELTTFVVEEPTPPEVDTRVFDLLEQLKLHFPDIAGAFARDTGGVDWTYINVVLKEKKPLRGATGWLVHVDEASFTPETSQLRLGLIATLIKATKEWFATR